MRYVLFLFSIFFSSQVNSQGYLKADNKMITDAKGNEVLLRGVGLGGWMLQEPYMLQLSGAAKAQYDIRRKITSLTGKKNTVRFYEAWLANHCRKSDIDSIAAWGFNSLRLPMHFNLFTLPIEQEPVKGKNTWLKKGFQLTDSLVEWCKANKVYVILDLHAAPGGQGNDIAISDRDTTLLSLWESEENKKKTIALWQKLAERYAGEEWVAGYDLINEPNIGFTDVKDDHGCAEKENKPLVDLLKRITTAIRQVDKKHLIFIEGNCWANNYNGFFPLWDNNLVITFHKYWNHTTEGSIQQFLDYREKYNVPIWMGETGENSNSWFTDAVSLFERNKLGWNLWPLKKLGINNPLQVRIDHGYQELLNYWKGNGKKPSKRSAINALMQLTENLKTENNISRTDVVDALSRQVISDKTIPFRSNTIPSINILYAVDYDLGRKGIAYDDNVTGNYWVSTNKRTDWNNGWQYRNEGVDIELCSDSITNGYNIGWIEDGEWAQYTINVAAEGLYDISIRTATKNEQGKISLMINDKPVERIDLAPSGENYNWKTKTIKNVKLEKGWNRMKWFAIKGGFNLNYFQFRAVDNTAKND